MLGGVLCLLLATFTRFKAREIIIDVVIISASLASQSSQCWRKIMFCLTLTCGDVSYLKQGQDDELQSLKLIFSLNLA